MDNRGKLQTDKGFLMAVYVGVPMWPFGRMIMCHMFADTNEELEEMRKKLRLSKSWEQKPRDSIGPHYDIAKSKRTEAIKLGAIACDTMHEEVDALDKVEAFRHQ